MLQKYFRFTKKRILTFLVFFIFIIALQVILTGPLTARQKVTVDAGNSESAVIGILDKTELVRQKFKFDRKVILSEFALSFGSFERDEVGDELKIQMLDGDNNMVYETTVPVDKITPNAAYRIAMDYTVTIPKGATCCIRISCSSKDREYDTVPTLNTTNRTNPNTYMSTLKMKIYEFGRILNNIEIKRFTNLSYLLWQKAFHTKYMLFKSRKYCKYTLGADGLDNVYRVLYAKKHHFDGIIHTKPFGCTPEIGALPIIQKAASDANIPILFFSFDNQTSQEGIKTRLEAFYDLIYLRKEKLCKKDI